MKIPELTGESLRDALEILTLMDINVTVDGEGYITEQIESEVNGERSIHLSLAPYGDSSEQEDEELEGEDAEKAQAEADVTQKQPVEGTSDPSP